MLNVGGAAASKVYVGGTEASAVYVGSAKVWPTGGGPPIPEVKGTPTAATGNTVALPAHSLGDLIVVFAQNHNTLTAAAPTVPVADTTIPAWNTLYKNTSNDGVPIHVGWHLATRTNHTSGAWTGANGMSAVVFTNVNQVNPIGSVAGVKTISTAGSSPVLPALSDPGPSALMTYYAVAYSTGGFGDPPAGYVKHFSDARLCLNSKSDTNSYAPVPMAHSSGASLTWRNVAFEVLSPDYPAVEPPYLYGVDVESLPGYEVKFTLKKGLPVSGDEAFNFTTTSASNMNGYVTRVFTKTFPSAGWKDCSIQDLYGDGTANPDSRKTITVQVQAKA
jgi:hypothetical protein